MGGDLWCPLVIQALNLPPPPPSLLLFTPHGWFLKVFCLFFCLLLCLFFCLLLAPTKRGETSGHVTRCLVPLQSCSLPRSTGLTVALPTVTSSGHRREVLMLYMPQLLGGLVGGGG